MNFEEFNTDVDRQRRRQFLENFKSQLTDDRKKCFEELSKMFSVPDPYAEFKEFATLSPNEAQIFVDNAREICDDLFNWMDEIIETRCQNDTGK